MSPPDDALEASLDWPVCGVDEVGRGPWAGPVLACAVILDLGALDRALIGRIDDSKALKPADRRAVAQDLMAAAVWAVGEASVAEIDRLNVLRASHLAMRRAVAGLATAPVHALVDGHLAAGLPCPETPVVGGDGRCLSIAAASIVAKHTRDALMAALGRNHPGYGWERNAGYGVPAHRAAIEAMGLTPHHRLSFAPIRAAAERLGYRR